MVEGARLESVYTWKRIAGSNPALSATFFRLHRLARVVALAYVPDFYLTFDNLYSARFLRG